MNHANEMNDLNSEDTTIGEPPSLHPQLAPPVPSTETDEISAPPSSARHKIATRLGMSPDITLEQFLPICLDAWCTRITPDTMATYISIVRNHILPFLGGTNIRAWDSCLIQEFNAYLDKKVVRKATWSPLTRHTKQCVLNVLRLIGMVAMEYGVLRENPVRHGNRSVCG